MDFAKVIADFPELFRKYWSTIALVITWVGVLIAWWRRRTNWRLKQFNEVVNFSLNYVKDGRLAMRTLLETTASEVWLNDYGVGLIRAALKKTTAEQPFILLKDADDSAFVNRAVLNVLSEHFAHTFVAEALGTPVKAGVFYFAITYERYEIMRTYKLRVLIVEEQQLQRLFGPDNEAARLTITDQWHQARLNTLRQVHDLYIKNQTTRQALLNKVELGIVT